jgi:hypothetical protein
MSNIGRLKCVVVNIFIIVTSIVVGNDPRRFTAVEDRKRVLSCTYYCGILQENPPLVTSDELRISSGLTR